jgi:Spx/MgsR family transcriptional regulator
MKKAFDALNEKGLSYEFHDYKKQGIDAETLKVWLEKIGADTLLNKKGTTWRKLSADEQQFALSSEANLIETLIAHPSLIKRPVLQTLQVIWSVLMKALINNLHVLKLKK